MQKGLEFAQLKAQDRGNYVFSEYQLKGANRQFVPYPNQTFVGRLMHPEQSLRRVMLVYTPGAGKTASAGEAAMPYISMFQERTRDKYPPQKVGRVFIVGFTEDTFRDEFLKYSYFGFVSQQEINEMIQLQNAGERGRAAFKALQRQYRRRLTNTADRGFFKFIGYKALALQLFPKLGSNLDKITPEELLAGVESGKIGVNKELLYQLEQDSLMICDESHRLYNSGYFNQWGVAIQIILERTNVKAMFLSATPINTSPGEFTEVANLVRDRGEPKLERSDLFQVDAETDLTKPKPGAVEQLKKQFMGKVCFLHDNTGKEQYPEAKFIGEPLIMPEDSVYSNLFVTRCELSDFQQIALNIGSKGAMGFDQLNVCDWVVPVNAAVIKQDKFKIPLVETSSSQKLALCCNREDISVGSSWDQLVMLQEPIRPTGPWLKKEILKEFSSCMYRWIVDARKALTRGKQLACHPNVRNGGVMALFEVALANGWIELGEKPKEDTLCVNCGREMRSHGTSAKTTSVRPNFSGCTEFIPARVAPMYAELDTNRAVHLLFKAEANLKGNLLNMVIGSRMITESWDFSAIRNLYKFGPTEGAAKLVQLFGRGIRKHSHSSLPFEERNIEIRIYMAVMSSKPQIKPGQVRAGLKLIEGTVGSDEGQNRPAHKLGPQERLYRKKVLEWTIIQKLSRDLLHKYAIDADLNEAINRPTSHSSSMSVMSIMPYSPDDSVKISNRIERARHDAWYSHELSCEIIRVIKAAFSQEQTCWTFDFLFHYVRTGAKGKHTVINLSQIDKIDFVIALNSIVWNTGFSSDVSVEKFLMSKSEASTYFNSMYNPVDKRILLRSGGEGVIMQISPVLYMLFSIDANDKPKIGTQSPFRLEPHIGIDSINISNYRYNLNPKEQFIPRMKQFGQLWEKNTSDKARRTLLRFRFSRDFRAKMLEHIITAKTHENWQKELLELADSMDLLAYPSTIKNSSCRAKNRISSAKPKEKPCGHWIGETGRIYKEKTWRSLTLGENNTDENEVIVGYYEYSRNEDALPKLKIRRPEHLIPRVADSRMIERGSVCQSRSREDLYEIITKLNKLSGSNIKASESVVNLCNELEKTLLELEAKRANKTRWIYFADETRPI